MMEVRQYTEDEILEALRLANARDSRGFRVGGRCTTLEDHITRLELELAEAEQQRDRAQQRCLQVESYLLERARLYQEDDGTEGRVGGWGWRDIAHVLRVAANEVAGETDAYCPYACLFCDAERKAAGRRKEKEEDPSSSSPGSSGVAPERKDLTE